MNKKNSLLDNDEAVAHGLFVIGVFLVLGTLLYVSMIDVVDQSNGVMNELIGQGVVSEETRNVYANQIAAIEFTPIFMLIGLFCWGIVRALEKKRTEG